MIKKKIAIIGLKGLPAFGGAARAGESVINILKDKYDITVYAIDSHTENKGPFNGYYQHVFKTFKNSKISVFTYYLRSALHCLFRGKYDLIQTNFVESGYIVPLLRLRYKVVGTARGGGGTQDIDKWSKNEKRLFRFFEFFFLKFCSVIVAVSKPHIPRYQGLTKKKIIHIPNGIHLNEDYSEDIKNRDYIFFAAARIIGIKGCHIMLESLKNIQYQGEILIAGDLEQIPSYKEEILELAKGLNVKFLGLVKEKKLLMGYLKNARFFIFPSFMEAMSNMLLEAASMQVPILCSDIVENKAIFKEGDVTFFKSGDVSDMQAKIEYLLDNPETATRSAQAAYQTLKEEYLWTQIAKQYDDLYEGLMD